MESFAKRFKAALEEKGWTEAALAKRLGVTQQTINNWKHGKSRSRKMYEAAEELGVSPEWLIKGTGPVKLEKSVYDKTIESIVSSLSEPYKKTLLELAEALKKAQGKADE